MLLSKPYLEMTELSLPSLEVAQDERVEGITLGLQKVNKF